MKLVDNAIAARKSATTKAQGFQAATGSPFFDGAAAASSKKACSGQSSFHAEAKESVSKAREEIPAVQKIKVKCDKQCQSM